MAKSLSQASNNAGELISKSARRMVNRKKMNVVIVYRCITDHRKYNVTSTCIFTKAGQLLNLFWSNSEYFLHIDPEQEVHERRACCIPIPLTRLWNKDKQIYSLYLDKQVEYDAKIRSYTLRHQELKRVVSDWVQIVLQTKPPDLVSSAVQFLSSFVNQTVQECNSDEIDSKFFN